MPYKDAKRKTEWEWDLNHRPSSAAYEFESATYRKT
jgi:hypothetical protein